MKTKLITLNIFFVLNILHLTSQVINIPDPGFKKLLLNASTSYQVAKNVFGSFDKVDLNGDKEIDQSEANNIAELHMDALDVNEDIVDLTGVNLFSNLKFIDFRVQKLDTFRLDNHPNIQTIICGTNLLKLLELTNLPSLDSLECRTINATNGPHKAIFQNLPKLRAIEFGGNNFPENILDNLQSLQIIKAYAGIVWQNKIVDLSKHNKLTYVSLPHNLLSNIVFPNDNKISYLDISSNRITDINISMFPELRYLNISINKLTSLDVSNHSKLDFLACANNVLTSLKVRGSNNLTLITCVSNKIKELDLSGLFKLKTLAARVNDNFSKKEGLSQINLTGCYSLEDISYSGDYLKSLDLSCPKKLARLDLEGAKGLKFINLKNGVKDSESYFYLPSTLEAIGVDFQEKFQRPHDTIWQTPYLTLKPECRYWTLTGNVKFDLQNNGCDSSDDNLPYARIEYGYDSFEHAATYSNKEGNYILYSPSNSFNIYPLYGDPKFKHWKFDPDTIKINFTEGIDSMNMDLCLVPIDEFKDLEVALIPLNVPRPGFTIRYKIIYTNKGNRIHSDKIELAYPDSLMTIISSSEVYSNKKDTLTWKYVNLKPFESREIEIAFSLNTPLDSPPLNGNDSLILEANVFPLENDSIPENNTAVVSSRVVNSFDPNDITCLEGTFVSPNYIDEYVHYLIRFENLGNGDAINVVVRNYIDTSKFEIETLSPINSSHKPNIQIKGNIVEFIFEGINLPFIDSINDGYIVYKIKTKSDLKIGEKFSNLADIYFDYNAPVATNIFTTTIFKNTTRTKQEERSNYSLYPNPVTSVLYIKNIPLESIELYDLNGRSVFASKFDYSYSNRIYEVDIKKLESGLYIAKIKSRDGKIYCEKIQILR